MHKFSELFENYVSSNSLEKDSMQLALSKVLENYFEPTSGCVIGSIQAFFNPQELRNTRKGLYIWGEVGVGKTMVLNLFFESLKTSKKLRKHFHEFMLDTHNALHRFRGMKSSDALKAYIKELSSQYEIIILDELQINNIADAMIVYRLFAGLAKRKTTVIFSSNRPPNELFKDGLQRERFMPFIHYVEQEFDVFCMKAAVDYRLKNFEFHQVYFYPNDKKADKNINKITMSLTGGHNLSAQEIEIASNHHLLVHQCYGHLASFTFNELCATNLGAVDYLKICDIFSIIIISDIPILSSDMHNEALRFITLIDCLYERNIKLICSSACDIDSLYSDGKHTFEFKRTISRLKEMQTSAYLGKSLNEIYRDTDAALPD